MDNAEIPTKVMQVPDQLYTLRGKIDELASIVLSFEERLLPVLRAVSISAALKETEVPMPNLVPVANELSGFSGKIEININQINDYIQRLEI